MKGPRAQARASVVFHVQDEKRDPCAPVSCREAKLSLFSPDTSTGKRENHILGATYGWILLSL